MQYLETIVGCGLFQNLNSTFYEKAYQTLQITSKYTKKGEIIFCEGDEMTKLAILKNGVVRGEKTYRNGDVNLLQFVETGELFAMEGVSTFKTATMNYISNEDCELILISWDSIYRSEYCKELLQMLMQKLEDDQIRQMHKVEILAKKGIRERLVLYFEIRREKEKSNQIQVNMDRYQLAEYLCVNRSVLSSELNKMQKEGLIAIGKKQITLLY